MEVNDPVSFVGDQRPGGDDLFFRRSTFGRRQNLTSKKKGHHFPNGDLYASPKRGVIFGYNVG